MIITSQGFGHFTQGLNNQDFGMETDRMLLVLDGCSGAKYAEVGTRLFGQLLSKKEEYDNPEKFEEKVKETFEDLLQMFGKYYESDDEFENDFIMENLLFTIIACFDAGDKYIVKMLGDGYIFTQNNQGRLSYMKFSYGKCPPYFAYRYCPSVDMQNLQFKTYEFEKQFFPRVGIGSDGILPIVKGEVTGIDPIIAVGNEIVLATLIKGQRQRFYDDVTIGFFLGGSENGN